MAMRLADVSTEDVRTGANWRVLNPTERERGGEPQALEIERAIAFEPDDHAVYSAVQVTDSGKAWALLLVRRVGDLDYGGDYYVFKGECWRRVGLEPDPTAEFSSEYVANPPENDPSFDSDGDELRTMYKAKFRLWVDDLQS